MAKFIIGGIDSHDANLLLKIGADQEPPDTMQFANSKEGRQTMYREVRRRRKEAGAEKVVFAYEASSTGFGLYDDIREAGFECHVLAPSALPRSHKHSRKKNDERDAKVIYEHLRGHLLAGNDLCSVWIPDPQTRNDRELVRGRVDIGIKLSMVKTQTQALLKRADLRRPKHTDDGWNDLFRDWLKELTTSEKSKLEHGARLLLASYLRQIKALEDERAELDEAVLELSQTPRYQAQVHALTELVGVGVLTAMVFLTEMGDLSRFGNRRQIADYMGVVPSSDESGEADDRKGHITRQGSWRLRRTLCEAAWVRSQHDREEKEVYDRIVGRNPKHKKIAAVALMRRLGIKMWHVGLAYQPTLPTAAESAKRRQMHTAQQIRRRKERRAARALTGQ